MHKAKGTVRDYIRSHWKEDWRTFAGEFAPTQEPEPAESLSDDDLFAFPDDPVVETEVNATDVVPGSSSNTQAVVEVPVGVDRGDDPVQTPAPEPRSQSTLQTLPPPVESPSKDRTPEPEEASLPGSTDVQANVVGDLPRAEDKQPSAGVPIVAGEESQDASDTRKDVVDEEGGQAVGDNVLDGAVVVQGSKRKAEEGVKKEGGGPGPRQKKRKVADGQPVDTTVSRLVEWGTMAASADRR